MTFNMECEYSKGYDRKTMQKLKILFQSITSENDTLVYHAFLI